MLIYYFSHHVQSARCPKNDEQFGMERVPLLWRPFSLHVFTIYVLIYLFISGLNMNSIVYRFKSIYVFTFLGVLAAKVSLGSLYVEIFLLVLYALAIRSLGEFLFLCLMVLFFGRLLAFLTFRVLGGDSRRCVLVPLIFLFLFKD